MRRGDQIFEDFRLVFDILDARAVVFQFANDRLPIQCAIVDESMFILVAAVVMDMGDNDIRGEFVQRLVFVNDAVRPIGEEGF